MTTRVWMVYSAQYQQKYKKISQIVTQPLLHCPWLYTRFIPGHRLPNFSLTSKVSGNKLICPTFLCFPVLLYIGTSPGFKTRLWSQSLVVQLLLLSIILQHFCKLVHFLNHITRDTSVHKCLTILIFIILLLLSIWRQCYWTFRKR